MRDSPRTIDIRGGSALNAGQVGALRAMTRILGY